MNSYREDMTFDERLAIRALDELGCRGGCRGGSRLGTPEARDFIEKLKRRARKAFATMTFKERLWLFGLIINQKKRIASEHYDLAMAFHDRIHGREGSTAKTREAVSG